MSRRQTIDKLIRNFSIATFGYNIDYASTQALIQWGIDNGYLTAIEAEHDYTFNGITASLTDAEFADIMSALMQDRKISAIKKLRDKGQHNLKEAKEFCDHLGEIVSKAKLDM